MEEFLQWYYAAERGQRARATALFDDFTAAFFRNFNTTPLDASAAKQLLSRLLHLEGCIDVMRKLIGGEWPYTHQDPVTAWDRSRLQMLVLELGHTHCIPLLLAATKLKHTMFSDIVFALERFVFRYKIICGQHIGPAAAIYYDNAKTILSSPAKYRTGKLVGELKALLDERASEDRFRHLLAELRYTTRGSNKVLKYLFITIEDHWRWFRDGAKGKPRCKDKARLFDFAGTTIEHVYPQNASVKAMQGVLEPMKNTLGNLTILGPEDNVDVDQKGYESKRPFLVETSMALNREFEDIPRWTTKTIKERQKRLIDAAVRIFSI